MTNQDAIYYLQYLRHDIVKDSPYDVAIVTAIASLTEKEQKTNGDRLRNMTDEELAKMVDMRVCRIVKPDGKDCPKGFYFGKCDKCVISWLRKGVSEDAEPD